MSEFKDAGKNVGHATVRISKRIIQLFSEGLYSSPNKAVEELVCNAFDANAQNVHVVIPDNLHAENATISVIDDGESMGISGLQEHWILGKSTRRDRSSTSSSRKPIGKFGIGKLATYILANCLTHVCKLNGEIHAVTMDYDKELSGKSEEIFEEKNVNLPIRNLRPDEAERIIDNWRMDAGADIKNIKLFGGDSTSSWTVAIMSDLKDAGKNVQFGRLRWVLRTAMPLRDDFKLYLNGELLSPSKINIPRIKKWVIGKDITEEKTPALDKDDFWASKGQSKNQLCSLNHKILDKVTGYVELYEDELSGGKSDRVERSNGFFVYVRDRMINADDPGFGVERHVLRHGTFSRMRVVVHIDSLDDDLRSSREMLYEGKRYTIAKNLMRILFNVARVELDNHNRQFLPEKQLSARIADTAPSLTRKPLFSAVKRAIKGGYSLEYVSLPVCPDDASKDKAITAFKNKIDSDEDLISEVVIEDDIANDKSWARYNVENGVLTINLSHPFVAFAQDMLQSANALILEMIIVGEILHESYLYYSGFDHDQVKDIIDNKDELLRSFVRASGRSTAAMVSLQLKETKNDPKGLERAMVASFEKMGFENVTHLGGSNQPDGIADAWLPAIKDGSSRRYRVGLEAKSGRKKIDANRISVSAIERHMNEYECNHHLIVGNEFPLPSQDKDSAIVKEIRTFMDKSEKTITLITIDDFAKLVRIVPAKRIGLGKLRDFFKRCKTHDESRRWVDDVAKEPMPDMHHKEILEAIWKLGNARPTETVDYGTLSNELSHLNPEITLTKKEVKDACVALQNLSQGGVYARQGAVEINQHPDLILAKIRQDIDNYPKGEKKVIRI